MRSLEIPLITKHPDLKFIPAYASALLSAQYALAKHPTTATRLITPITSILAHYAQRTSQSDSHPTATIQLWPIPSLAMAPICLILSLSVAGILTSVKADRLYATMVLGALCTVFGAGKVLDLDAEVVVFGLLPFIFVSALGVVRIGQSCSGTRNIAKGGLPEKV